MNILILTGLVSIERAQLSIDLAQQRLNDGFSVQIVDNIARQPIELKNPDISIERLEGDILLQLPEIVASSSSDTLIIAVSEQTHPEKLFVAVDTLQEQFSDDQFFSLAMIDTRTCDCFPNVRQALEMYADATVMLPYQLDEVLNYVFATH